VALRLFEILGFEEKKLNIIRNLNKKMKNKKQVNFKTIFKLLV